MSSFLPDVLNRWRSLRLVTVEELATWADVPVATMYKQIEKGDMPFSQVRRISREACRAKGLTDLSASLLTPDFEVRRREAASANGRIDDDVTKAVVALGGTASAFDQGDIPVLDAQIEALDDARAAIKAERDRLAAQTA